MHPCRLQIHVHLHQIQQRSMTPYLNVFVVSCRALWYLDGLRYEEIAWETSVLVETWKSDKPKECLNTIVFNRIRGVGYDGTHNLRDALRKPRKGTKHDE